jgi:hypothetical protein
MCIQLLDCALQLFKFLPSLAELAFRCQALVVGKVFGSLRDERAEVRVAWDDGAVVGRRICSAGTGAALTDETAPPNSATIADSKVGPYASRSCSASTTRRNPGMGLRSACR